MEQPRPMDRLLCGDVGYGKTEVAIRAAFKAVMDSKQVAILVPTTILAHQHYETFKERFSGFPVTIEMLSRFRSRKEALAVAKGLTDGSVDIVIGTHRLLQKSLHFKDLGLLVVDEEQRFGVTHKERLKQLRTNVDCLTLTATPIPRTLHMSLLGVRDLSIIETPPENRFPVQTYVVEYNDALVREALERELSRGGQVYFLYNQVSNINRMAERVRELVPDATVAIAHGQMPEDELERVMLDFLDGTIDVLVTTTIIETGLDIPNVNTLVVYDGDRLGLSQLYQLRGRVGRSHRIAYAYFTYQRDKALTEVAEKRLQAIKEFTELGSGFKIAMRDLAIRGAGNLLGAEQHGFINSVGFDMYNDMLSQAVKEIRGQQVQEPPEPMIDLALEAYLPDDFISDAAQKIAMYKKFKYVHSLEGADDLEEELEDRFGDLPDAVRNLLDITRIKSYGLRYGVESVTTEGLDGVVRVRSEASQQVDPGKMFGISKMHSGDYRTRSNGMVQVAFRLKGLNDRQICAKLLRFFHDYEMAVRTESDAVVESQLMANS
jgi:transcription-repair coupling factor (superfamily II helicase)